MSVEIVHCTDGGDDLIEYIARVSSPKNQAKMDAGELSPGKLIGYLARSGHWSPFEMVGACISFETTRAISAQMLRHRSFSFQEFSQRYAEVTGEIDVPEMRAKHVEGNRQGSGEYMGRVTIVDHRSEDTVSDRVENALLEAQATYDDLLDAGVAPECARMVLPMCSPTKLYMHGTIRSWHHYFQQRCSEHAQKEHRELALVARDLLTVEFPIVAEALGWN